VAGLISTNAERACALARDYPSNPVFLEMSNLDEIELALFRHAKHKEELKNLHLILPPTRTISGLLGLKKDIAGEGISRSKQTMFYFPIAFPSNVVLLDRFFEAGLDGVVFDGKKLAEEFLGTNAFEGDLDDSVLWALDFVCELCRRAGLAIVYSGFVDDKLIERLFEKGIRHIVTDSSDSETMLFSLMNAENKLLNNRV